MVVVDLPGRRRLDHPPFTTAAAYRGARLTTAAPSEAAAETASSTWLGRGSISRPGPAGQPSLVIRGRVRRGFWTSRRCSRRRRLGRPGGCSRPRVRWRCRSQTPEPPSMTSRPTWGRAPPDPCGSGWAASFRRRRSARPTLTSTLKRSSGSFWPAIARLEERQRWRQLIEARVGDR